MPSNPAGPVLMLVAALAAQPVAAQQIQDHSTMLERVLPAVVTVAGVESADGTARAFGFADDVAVPGARTAYQRMLDLSPYDMSGSGFATDRAGRRVVVTNAHVIEYADPDQIYVFSVTRERYRMRILGADTYRDVAVLEFVDGPGPEIGAISIRRAADARIGMPVFAVGNPKGLLPYTVTGGIVSALNRTLDGLYGKFGYLQTDATIVGGNSGGPLIGPHGDVVGLNTSGYVDADLNFALDARHLDRIVDDIAHHGRVRRAYLGMVLVQEWDDAQGTRVRLAGAMEGSPAAAALSDHVGRYLAAIDNEDVESIHDAIGVFEQLRPGASVRLTLADPRGDRQVVRVSAGTLGNEEAAQIGSVVLSDIFGVSAVAGGNALTVTRGPERLPAHVEILDGSGSPPRGGEIIRHGATATWSDELIWRVDTLHELGVVARMALPTGLYAISLRSGGSERWAIAEFDPQIIL